MAAALYSVPASVLPRKTLTFEGGVQIIASFEEKSAAYKQLVGADLKTVVLDLWALLPNRVPDIIRVGSRAELEWRGRTVTLEIESITVGQAEPEVNAEGQHFLGVLRGTP